MLIDSTSFRPSTFACRTAALALFACASTLGLHAQQGDAAKAPNAGAQLILLGSQTVGYKLDLSSLDLTKVDGVSYSSSAQPLANAGVTETAALDFKGLPSEATQPPPRRRYGRPRYNDSNHNPDGSPKYAFLAGVGVTLPSGNLHKYDTDSYGFQVGGGRNFNKNASIIAQFDYDHFGLQGSTIANQTTLYNFYCTPQLQAAGVCVPITGLDGNSHIWSFTLDPTYNIAVSEGVGAYVVAGVGFYHKVTNFTLPTPVCLDYFCNFQTLQNQNIDHYTSNAPGFNAGFGLTYKASRFANERFYVEARYVFVDNQKRTGVTAFNSGATLNAYNGNNFYPQNSNRSSYIPVKVGIRF